MKLLTAEEIERDARLCASHGDKSDCRYPEGTAAHRVWMAAYRGQCRVDADDADLSYQMHPDHQPYPRMERL